jgi:hypothetical protein
MLLIATDGVIVNVRGAGCGVEVMFTDAVPVDAIKAAGTFAVSCPEDTKVVVRLLPFQVIWVPCEKFVPLTVRVKAGPPATAELGDMLVSVAPGLMVKVNGGGDGCPD